jgi:hypothetical protein
MLHDRYRAAIRHAMLLQANGGVQRDGQVIHVVAGQLHDLSNVVSHLRFAQENSIIEPPERP